MPLRNFKIRKHKNGHSYKTLVTQAAQFVTCKVPNTTIAEFSNTVDQAHKMAHNKPSHLDLQRLPSDL